MATATITGSGGLVGSESVAQNLERWTVGTT